MIQLVPPTPAPGRCGGALPVHNTGGSRISLVPGIGVLRGVVCLGVLSVHLADEWSKALHPDGLAVFALRPGVESFLLLSGFFLASSFRSLDGDRLSVRQFAARRVLRLAVPYWVAVVLATLVAVAQCAHLGVRLTTDHLLEFLSQLLFVRDVAGLSQFRVYGNYWSMLALFQFYVIWTAIFWLARRQFLHAGRSDYHARALRVLDLCSWSVVVLSVPSLFGWGVPFPWGLTIGGVYLAAGVLVYRTTVGRSVWAVVALLGVFAASGLYSGASRPVWGAITGALLLYLSRPGHTWTTPASFDWLAAIGRWSFSIYLVHGIVGFLVESVGRRLGMPLGWHTSGGYVLTAMPLSVAAGFVFYRLVEIPMARLASRIKYR